MNYEAVNSLHASSNLLYSGFELSEKSGSKFYLKKRMIMKTIMRLLDQVLSYEVLLLFSFYSFLS